MVKVINRKTHPNVNGIYVGRPSKFGNPFNIGRDGDRKEVVEKYRQYLLSNNTLIQAAKDELKGHDLICFCAPEQCHADVLLEIANGESMAETPFRTIPDFNSSEERSKWIVDHADYFTVIRRVNRCYERYEEPTLAAAEGKAKSLVAKHGGRFMLYAVYSAYDTYVATVSEDGITTVRKNAR